MAFIPYKGERVARSPYKRRIYKDQEVAIRINTKGTLCFSAGAKKVMTIEPGCACRLYFNKVKQQIGIRIVHGKVQGYTNKIYMVGERPAIVSGRGFLNIHGIDFSVSQKYVPWYDEKEKLWVIQLESRE